MADDPITTVATVVSWEPKWTAPVVDSVCPACGVRTERRATAWTSRTDGSLSVTTTCELGARPGKCWRVFTIEWEATDGT